MGCCCSFNSRLPESPHSETSFQLGIPTGPSKPLQRNYKWKPEHLHWTMEEIQQKRQIFWDTQPKYEGKMEIWQTLKAACEAEDDQIARVFIESANINCPTGLLSDGCYDELGNRYVIPFYCFSLPDQQDLEKKNIIEEEEEDNSKQSKEASSSHSKFVQKYDIICRLSTGKDILLKECLASDTFSKIRRKLLEADQESLKNAELKFLCMGKIMTDDQHLSDCLQIKSLLIKDASFVLQVLIRHSDQ